MKTMNKTISKKNKKNMISKSFYLKNVENGDSDEKITHVVYIHLVAMYISFTSYTF